MNAAAAITAQQVERFRATIAAGGIAIFPTDTLYGIACDPNSRAAVDRIYELKGRSPSKPSAVMFFSVERLFAALPKLTGDSRRLVEQVLPGPFTLVVRNPAHCFAPACAGDPEKLGIRVPNLDGTAGAALERMPLPVMQTSANTSGAPDATKLAEIDPVIRAGVDLELNGGALLGNASTVADISDLDDGRWQLLRAPMTRSSTRLTELIGFPPTDSA